MLFRFLTWAVSGQPNYMLTSRPYAVVAVEEVEANQSTVIKARYFNTNVLETADAVPATIEFGVLEQAFFLVEYENYAVEAIDATASTITSGNLYAAASAIIEYSLAEPEAAESNAATVESGVLEQAFFLIDYTNYPAEATEAISSAITGGTLT